MCIALCIQNSKLESRAGCVQGMDKHAGAEQADLQEYVLSDDDDE